ncbi:hypothetical protein OUZ56_031593 [Daphnia magna]|uniref:Uncharacterized protein n=1 Tax=Daphnia magna TaxID=35525 RepID=A0ABQ9ZUS3_9CRUS|nr:hypothetical protein OUZ56_031593 [Daphnia magna]
MLNQQVCNVEGDVSCVLLSWTFKFDFPCVHLKIVYNAAVQKHSALQLQKHVGSVCQQAKLFQEIGDALRCSFYPTWRSILFPEEQSRCKLRYR